METPNRRREKAVHR
ncbi:unnamed protein product [Acanthoscelides obtectus]|uniref:Uncharacterized protein n=1 Tax=Acanthoscelides obtectus TaxID=200917 RepID=A0A9P0KPS9_ACAOB|nr:unnamed protein product [Acanthoscelides obtectus]CAK1634370.1 hypothetical protein AOBTE_LOCUS8734 [Acanthoscelides obtectus]